MKYQSVSKLCFNSTKAIKVLLLSATLLSVSITVSQACIAHYGINVLLGIAPNKLHGATFMGKVKLTRVTQINNQVIARAILQDSKTHPQFVGKKMVLIVDSSLKSLCGPPDYIPIEVGSEGFAIGRALKLGSEILYVKPHTITGYLWDLNVQTESERIPLSEFY